MPNYSKHVLLPLITAILFMSCSSSPPVSPESEETEEPIEPTASIMSPGENSLLNGVIALTLGGESEEGFDEVRISIDGDQWETIESPSLPLERDIETYTLNNGVHDITVEFDVTNEDTTLYKSNQLI